ncbi:amidohydrolase [Paenarthrobacter sp. JL.01a]|uniref:amidohydrolase n=1 Tax=Paenarthrobacter sp. JL.01a TaxID=2979324 RepID=UPI0021CA5F81|nr:amidohydrolase [Paenarthrobacter sp. JL.01a]UXM92500.1 amidohydrolase [Paenarthrobacter sp. JL.01a]
MALKEETLGSAHPRTAQDIKARVLAEIDRQAERIVAISREIQLHPETGFREFGTARRIAAQFEDMGIDYRSGLARTGVKARMTGRSDRHTVALLGEMDSVITPDHPLANQHTGAAHACGHHIEIGAMIGAALGLQGVMDQLDGDVVLFALPAEELIEVDWRLSLREAGDIEFVCGKPELIRLGEFDDIDLGLITHPSTDSTAPLFTMGHSFTGSILKKVTFTGKTGHAGENPHESINALKALTLALTALESQRETFRDEDSVRISQLITNSGEMVSTIPGLTELEVMIRGRSIEALEDASNKVDRSMQAGAVAVGAEVEITTVVGCFPFKQDQPLVELVDSNGRQLFGDNAIEGHGRPIGASTDSGDLQLLLPLVLPLVNSGCDGLIHSRDFTIADHVLTAVNNAKLLAVSVVDLLCDGATKASQVIEESGPKLDREAFLKLRRRMENTKKFL